MLEVRPGSAQKPGPLPWTPPICLISASSYITSPLPFSECLSTAKTLKGPNTLKQFEASCQAERSPGSKGEAKTETAENCQRLAYDNTNSESDLQPTGQMDLSDQTHRRSPTLFFCGNNWGKKEKDTKQALDVTFHSRHKSWWRALANGKQQTACKESCSGQFLPELRFRKR